MREGNRIARAPAGPCLLLSSRRGSLAFSPPGRIITIMLGTKAFRDIFAPHRRYGDIFPATVSAKGLPYLFTGREFNPIDGADSNYLKLQYSRARYYSFPLRRWLQRDPLEYVDGMNLYVYVQSNPIRFGDPFGLHNAKGCPEPEEGGFGSVLGGFFGGMIEDIEKLIQKKIGGNRWRVIPNDCSLTKVSHRGCIICKKRCKYICKVTVDIKIVFPTETCTLNLSASGVTVCTIGWVGCVLYIEPHACEDGMSGGKWEPEKEAKIKEFEKCLKRNLKLILGPIMK
ncbi:MAG TPA: RHS repeat-associated core domain-containing protein [Phycisphaerae bacterium]|nr:RHS repeat-associated core domain-containing protein [Phycisphaerae bacterium]